MLHIISFVQVVGPTPVRSALPFGVLVSRICEAAEVPLLQDKVE